MSWVPDDGSMAAHLAPLTAWSDQYLARKARIDGDHTVIRLRGVIAANDLALNPDDHDGVSGGRALFAYLISPYAEAVRSARSALRNRIMEIDAEIAAENMARLDATLSAVSDEVGAVK